MDTAPSAAYAHPLPTTAAADDVSLGVSLAQPVLIPASAALSGRIGRIKIYAVGPGSYGDRLGTRPGEPPGRRRTDTPASPWTQAPADYCTAATPRRPRPGDHLCPLPGTVRNDVPGV